MAELEPIDWQIQPGPCVICGATEYPLSMGGPALCPACDAYPAEQRVKQLADDNRRLRSQLAERPTGAYSKYFAGPNHALLTGIVWGTLMKAGIEADSDHDEQGDYTGRIIVTRPSGTWVVRVEPLDVVEP